MAVRLKVRKLVLIVLIALMSVALVFSYYRVAGHRVKKAKYENLRKINDKLFEKVVKNTLKPEEKYHKSYEVPLNKIAQEFLPHKTEDEFNKFVRSSAENNCDELTVEPKEINIEVEEGQRTKAFFRLKNNGEETMLINIYKAGNDKSEYEQLEYFIEHKENVFSGSSLESDLEKAALFSGVPWLKQFPHYCALEAGKCQDIELTVAAGGLSVEEYRTHLFIVGRGSQESLILPINVQVNAAPKIKLIQIEVDDGFSADTLGNMNNTADSGEKVALTMTFKNTGMADAEGVTLKICSDESCIHVLGDESIGVFDVETGGRFFARTVIEVSKNNHSGVPPRMNLNIMDNMDKESRKWVENFYLGEEGKFEYPKGLLHEEGIAEAEWR